MVTQPEFVHGSALLSRGSSETAFNGISGPPYGKHHPAKPNRNKLTKLPLKHVA